MVLTIVDLCLSVQSLAEQTTNANSIFNNNNNNSSDSKLSGREQFWFNQNDDHINGDKSETQVFQQNIDRSLTAYGKLNESYHHHSEVADDSDRKNFIISNYLSDGEVERRIHFNGVTAKETLVSNIR